MPNNYNVSLETVAGKLSNVHFHGRYVSACCPFHQDKSPSLLVYPDGFNCKSCHKKGSLKTLDARLSGNNRYMSDAKAPPFRWQVITDDVAGFAYNAHESVKNFPHLKYYFEKRGVDGLIDKCLLGWWEGWFTLPILDKRCNPTGIILRAGKSVEDSTGQRYSMPPGQKLLYVPDWGLVNKSDKVFMPFGMFDALILNTLGLASVTWTLGKDGSIDELIDQLQAIRKPIYLIPDKDEYPEAKSIASSLGWRGHVVKLKYPDGIKDPNGFAQQGKLDELKDQIQKYIH